MANVDILIWALQIMRLLVDNAGRPVTLAALIGAHPALSRNTVKNRMDTLVEAGWARESVAGYTLDPEFVKLLHRAQSAAANALNSVVGEVQTLLNPNR